MMPPKWVFGCFSIAPAVFSLLLDAWLHSAELQGKVRGDPAMGIAPAAGLLTLILCIGGSLPLAIGLTRGGDLWAALNAWIGLAILNLVITVPGCAVIF
ncbi:hypothetical protein [Chthoniobacter flavus]|uniref:hypothetical protein n=1 Tax=Chthoniobacter flavus TaxID=191863 RepID=UPI00104FBEF9|nr:hypothetical protein [Chthoniobacter flavus]